VNYNMFNPIDFVVVVKNNVDTIIPTLLSIKKQTVKSRIIIVCSEKSTDGTLNKILEHDTLWDIVVIENEGLGHARALGISFVRTPWFCFVDADVVLSYEWYLGMRLDLMLFLQDFEIGAICGRLYRNKAHLRYLSRFEYVFETDRMFTHNTMIRTELVKDWRPPSGTNAWEDHHLTKHIWNKGYVCITGMEFGFHDHRGSIIRAAAWNAAGARFIGKYKSLTKIVLSSVERLIWGVKNSIRFKSVWFFTYTAEQIIGTIIGYLQWNKYMEIK
jgi:glycosyltransferase involved in cell wall biosynthesis